MSQIAVLIDAKLHNELVLRTRSTDDVTGIIEFVLEDYLERTRYDDVLWSPAYIEELDELREDKERARTGDPAKGYHWGVLFLPNGTDLRMQYKGRWFGARIEHQKLVYQKAECSPSEFASRVANNTSRNAWRDIEIKTPNSGAYVLADVLRRQKEDQQ